MKRVAGRCRRAWSDLSHTKTDGERLLIQIKITAITVRNAIEKNNPSGMYRTVFFHKRIKKQRIIMVELN